MDNTKCPYLKKKLLGGPGPPSQTLGGVTGPWVPPFPTPMYMHIWFHVYYNIYST